MFERLKGFAARSVNSLKGAALAVGMAMVGATALTSQPASAAVDVTAVTTEIAGAIAPIGLIGAGVLLVLVAVKTYKWIRRAM
jgi:F0F1-type ATP synthase membrane subunit c/vacuolar-type H+-ATPase subunit K